MSRASIIAVLVLGLGLGGGMQPAPAAPAIGGRVALSPLLMSFTDTGVQGTAHAFRLTNLGSRPVTMMVAVGNWTMNRDGAVSVIPETEQSLAPWMEIAPKRFTIQPGFSQVVRFAIRPDEPLAPGEHRAMVWFTQVPGSASTAKTFHVVLRMGAAVYDRIPPLVRSSVIESTDLHRNALLVTVRNTGNITIRPHGTWSAGPIASGGACPTPAIAMPPAAILPGHVRVMAWPLPHPLPQVPVMLCIKGTVGATRIAVHRRVPHPLPPLSAASP